MRQIFDIDWVRAISYIGILFGIIVSFNASRGVDRVEKRLTPIELKLEQPRKNVTIKIVVPRAEMQRSPSGAVVFRAVPNAGPRPITPHVHSAGDSSAAGPKDYPAYAHRAAQEAATAHG